MERLWSRLDASGVCWEWTGALTPKGYGVIWYEGKLWQVHRLSYTLLVGPIPEGHTLDHQCRNTVCADPDHLDPVTQRVNMERGAWGAKWRQRAGIEVCSQGHPFTKENTYTGGGQRDCRICRRAASARYNAKMRLLRQAVG